MAEVTINDGLHLHALLALHPDSRLSFRLVHHLREQQHIYTDKEIGLFRLHAVPATDNHHNLTNYNFKQLLRGNFSSDDILIYPKAQSELGPRGRSCFRDDALDAD